MNNQNIPQPERYINPNRVNVSKPLRIFSTDPRNNPIFLRENPFTTVIAVDSISQLQNDEIDYLIDPDPNQFIISDPVPPNGENNQDSGNSDITAPANLQMNNFQLKISGDGTIYYIGTLVFDDVDGATSYEYSLEEIV